MGVHFEWTDAAMGIPKFHQPRGVSYREGGEEAAAVRLDGLLPRVDLQRIGDWGQIGALCEVVRVPRAPRDNLSRVGGWEVLNSM